MLVPAVSMALVLAIPAGAQSKETFRCKGKVADVVFPSVVGCIGTGVLVSAQGSKGRQAPQQGSGAPSEAVVQIYKYDACVPEPGPGTEGPEFITAAFNIAPLRASDFVVSKNLGSAALNTMVQVTDDVSGSTFAVGVDLDWTATAAPRRFKERYSYQTTGFSFSDRVEGVTRAASASGSVSDGTTQYATGSSDFASLLPIKSRYEQSGQPPEGVEGPGAGPEPGTQ